MKLLVFNAIRLEGEDNPKKIPLGKILICSDQILGFVQPCDKYDVVVEGCLIIRDKTGSNMMIEGTFDKLVEELNELAFS